MEQNEPELRWQAGVYSLVNMASGTCMELSSIDDLSIIGSPRHNGKNQQWRFESLGEGYTVRSVHTGHYLRVEDSATHDAILTVSAFPVAWKVVVVEEGEAVVIRILWPSERYAIALAGSGSVKPLTGIRLERTSPDFIWQRWQLVPREDPLVINPEPQPVQQQQQSTESTSTPVELIVVTEVGENYTTTTTTTTGTVTKVTIVTKTPRHGASS